MAKNRFEYDMEGVRISKGGKATTRQVSQGQVKSKKPAGDTAPRFNADPRMPKKKK